MDGRAVALLTGLLNTVKGYVLQEEPMYDNCVIEAFCRQVASDDVRGWFLSIIPHDASRKIMGGRLWIEYPVRINGDLYMKISHCSTGLYLIDNTEMIGFIPWEMIHDVQIPVRRR